MSYPPQQPYDSQPPVPYNPGYAPQAATYGTPQPAFPAAAVQTLDWEVAKHVQVGWAVESRTQTMAVLKSGSPPNHTLHLLLTIFTCGFWGVVWFFVAVFSDVKRLTLQLNHDGTVSRAEGRGGTR